MKLFKKENTMKALFLTLLAAFALAGCASDGQKAYYSAQDSVTKQMIVEANAKAESRKNYAIAVASIASKCESESCRMGALMTLNAYKEDAARAFESVKQVIAPPVDTALEWGKLAVTAATSLYSIRTGAVIKLGDMSRGAADKDVLMEGLSTLDVVRNTTPAP